MVSHHPLLDPDVLAALEHAAADHAGRPWQVVGFVDLSERASHPCGLLHGEGLSVFAKAGTIGDAEQFQAEVRGLGLVRGRSTVGTPAPIATGVVVVGERSILLTEALSERPPEQRSSSDWRAIGRVLAHLHEVTDDRLGWQGGVGYFGPLRQDNEPVASDRWTDFYAQRRVLPHLRAAVDAGHLGLDLAHRVDRLVQRLPALAGPEPVPSLLHGDAQQHNFISTSTGAVVVDVAPYFGHPEIDLALLDCFVPVPSDVFAGYAETASIDSGFWMRRELWRIFAYLAVIAVDGGNDFGRQFLTRLDDALELYA
jgi:protein-ribulosamine 3-kinase